MKTFLIAFGLFAFAVAAMAVGLLRGRRLSGSCGGVDADGNSLADCLCELANKPVCGTRRRELGLEPLDAGELEKQRAETARA